MTARTHDAFAFASLITIAAYFPPQNLTLYTLFASVVGNITGALIPDMDSAGNRLWDLLPFGNTVAKYFRLVFYKHRSITHSFLGLFLVYKLLEWVLPKLFNPSFVDPHTLLISMMIGYISHLIADGLTEEGLPLLFPFKMKFGFPPIVKWRITTGSWFEKFVIFPALGIYLFFFIQAHVDQLLPILKLIRK